MPTTVVCGVDQHDEAVQPLRFAQSLAKRLGRPLVVAHVVSADHLAWAHAPAGAGLAYAGAAPDPGTEVGELQTEARRRMLRLAEQCGAPDAAVEVTVDGDTAEALRHIARVRDAELLVVGSRGRGAARAVLLGSTAHALVASSPCPVVVVPAAEAG